MLDEHRMYEINKFEFYRALCPRFSHYCNECEHEFFDMNSHTWVCPYDRFGDVVSQISVLQAEFTHNKNEV